MIEHFKNFFYLTFTNICVQFISLVGFSVISRVFSVENIGHYVSFLAVVSIVSIFTTANYDQALYIERSKEGVYRLIWLSIFISLAVSTLAVPILHFLGRNHAAYIFFALLGLSFKKIHDAYLISNSNLKRLAFTNLVLAPMTPCFCLLGFYFFGDSEVVLIFVNALVTFLFSLAFLYFVLKNEFQAITRVLSERGEFRRLLIKYHHFFKYGVPGQACGTLSQRLPVLIIEKFADLKLAAQYGVSLRVALTPLGVVGGAVSQVFTGSASRKVKNKEVLIRDFLMFFIGLNIVYLGVFLLVHFFLKDLVLFAFTENYLDVVVIIKLLLPYIWGILCVSPLTIVLTIYDRQSYAFYNKLVVAIVSMISFGIGVYLENLLLGISIYSWSICVVYMLMFVQLLLVCSRGDMLNKGKE